MVVPPFLIWTAIIVAIALLTTPNNVLVSLSLRFIAEKNPIALLKNLLQTPSSGTPATAHRSTIVKSNYPTVSDNVFGNQKPVWKPAKSDDDYEDNYDDYSSGNEEQFDSESTTNAHSSFFEYLQKFLASVRFLAYNAWHDPKIFVQPEPTLVPPKDNESTTTAEEPERMKKMCEILMLSGIENSDCDSLVSPIEENVIKVVTSPWSEADEYGIQWKEVKEGKDKGCQYFLKASSVPLKMSASPNEDGSTKLSYYTKNTIGKYCPNGENDEEAIQFFKDLSEEIKPSKLSTFFNTRIIYDYTVFDMFEFHLLMDACLIALYRHFNQNNLGQPTNRSLAGFIFTAVYSQNQTDSDVDY
ncbi:hypothetical protein [Parasitella parasitica]|uniref:Uncharacterized protein n=1 Tax=Parasitella parasitica TaxID=35722 RepID=A0A0B7MXV7_9FUNG|nr:hypothetical protein [Parasitella parasitica]